MLVLVLACGLLLVQVMYDDFRDLHDAGARGADLGLYILVAVPGFLALTLPIVLLLSTLFVLGKLHKANELTAMRAAGVGFCRLMAPIWLVGLLCCALSYWLNSSVVPWSVERTRVMKESFQFKKQAQSLPTDRIGAVYSVGFDNPYPRRVWFFNRYSKYTQRAYGADVTEMDVRGRETNRIVATEAWYDEAQHGWVFKDGREMGFDPETGVIGAAHSGWRGALAGVMDQTVAAMAGLGAGRGNVDIIGPVFRACQVDGRHVAYSHALA